MIAARVAARAAGSKSKEVAAPTPAATSAVAYPVTREGVFNDSPVNAKWIALNNEEGKLRPLTVARLAAHMNETVMKPILGVGIKPELVADILCGISDQYIELLKNGYKIRVPKLCIMKKSKRAARKGYAYRTNEIIDIPERPSVSIHVDKSVIDALR